MNSFLGTLSLVGLTTILAIGAAPGFGQDTRDTRPTTRPTMSHDTSSHEEEAPPDEGRLPDSPRGFGCLIERDGHGIAYATNDSGKTVPAGTVLTWYAQPGNVQKTFKLAKDWKPGDKLPIPVAAGEIPHPGTCSIKLSPWHDGPILKPIGIDPMDPPLETGTPPKWELACLGPYLPNNPEDLNIDNLTPFPMPKGTHIKVVIMPGPVELELVTWADGSAYAGIVFDDVLKDFPDGIESCTAEVIN